MNSKLALVLFLLMASPFQTGNAQAQDTQNQVGTQTGTTAATPIRRARPGGFVKRLPTDVPTQLQVQRQWRQGSNNAGERLKRFQAQPGALPAPSTATVPATVPRAANLGQSAGPLLKPGEAEKILNKKAHEYRMQNPGFVDHPRNLPKDGEPASLKDALKRRADENKSNPGY